jgi:two-component system sensor histidine kinase/response regulator
MKILPFLLLVFLTDVSSSINAQSDKRTKSFRIVDSLNEEAFKVKRYDYSKALNLLATAESIATENNYSKGLAVCYLYEGGIYSQFGHIKPSLVFYEKALDISKQIKDSFNIARANQQLAGVIKEDGKLAEAEKMYVDALNLFTRLGKVEEVVNINNSIGLIDIEEKEYSNAERFFNTALIASKGIGYKYGEKKSYYNFGLLYKASGDKQKAYGYFLQSLAMDEVLNDKYGIALSKLQLAELYNSDNNLPLAISSGTDAYTNAKAVAASNLMTEAIAEIITAYTKQNNVKKVTEWQKVLISNLSQENMKEKEAAFDFIETIRQHENEQLSVNKQALQTEQSAKAQRILLIIAIIAFFALSVVVYLLYNNYKRSKMFGEELRKKSQIIQKNSESLDQLNRAISKQNQRLEEENRMKDKLLSIISHDLRHPLVNTKSILELISLKLVTPKETEELLEQLESQYVNSISLIDNLLFWIRGQMAGKDLELMSLNMRRLIGSLVDEHRLPISNKHIHVKKLYCR